MARLGRDNPVTSGRPDTVTGHSSFEGPMVLLLTHMMEDPRLITPSLELLLVSRNLERVADLATNIAEDAVYLAEAKLIKHHSEDFTTNR